MSAIFKFMILAAVYRRKFSSVFEYGYVSRFWRYTAICLLHFDQIFQSTAETLLISVPKSHTEIRLPVSILTLSPSRACDINLLNFVQIGWSLHVRFTLRSKAIGIPNFNQISQSTADILLLPVSEKTAAYWNSTSSLDFDLFTDIGVQFFIGIPNFIGIGSSAAEL